MERGRSGRRWAWLLVVAAALGGCGRKERPEIKPLEITLARLPDGVVDRDYPGQLSASGGTTPYTWRVSAGELPAGLSLAASTGAITGKPTAAGSKTLTIEARDSSSPAKTATKEYTLLVAEPLTLTTASLPDATVAVNYSAQLEKSGGTGNITWELVGALPEGVTFSASGLLAGLPIAEGSRQFTVRATDSADPPQSVTQQLSITVLPGTPGVVARASVDSMGAEADGGSSGPAVSADGRQVAFESLATNLVANDTNGAADIFLFDLLTGATTRLSLAASGAEANGPSRKVALAGTLSAAAFESDATNLIATDSNASTDVYLRLISAAATGRASVAAGGAQGSGTSSSAALSDDARFVAFASSAANLVPGDTNGLADVFLRDRASGTTTRLSAGPGGAAATGSSTLPASSGAGDAVAYVSSAKELAAPATSGETHIFVHAAGTNAVASLALNLPNTRADIFGPDIVGRSTLGLTPGAEVGRRVRIASGRGAGQERAISFNTTTTVVVTPPWDTAPDATSEFRVASEANGASNEPAISTDARFVAFESLATNLAGLTPPGVSYDTNGVADIFVHDRQTGITQRVSVARHLDNQAADLVGPASIGRTTLTMTVNEHVGRLVEVVAGTGAGQVRRVVANDDLTLTVDAAWLVLPDRTSVFRVGSEANGASATPAVSGDGRFIAFASDASNLVSGDTNGVRDIFVVDRETGEATRVSVRPDGTQADGASSQPTLSRDARFCAFTSAATNLIANDTNGVADVFLAFTGVPQQ